MDKLRQEFEEWFNKEMMLHISASNETVVRLMWKAWLSSRRAGAELAIEQAMCSIGLSIKGE